MERAITVDLISAAVAEHTFWGISTLPSVQVHDLHTDSQVYQNS